MPVRELQSLEVVDLALGEAEFPRAQSSAWRLLGVGRRAARNRLVRRISSRAVTSPVTIILRNS